MEIVYVNTPTQDENTENPQIINNHVPKWVVITMTCNDIKLERYE